MLHVGTYRHISAHVGTYQHILAHVGMSKCADACQHADKVQRVRIRYAESDGTCWHMSACPHVLTHASMQIRSKGFVSDMPRVMVHVGTCRHVHMC